VIAIELVNEAYPQDAGSLKTLKDYYTNGYEVVKAYNEGTVVVIGDAFEGMGAWLDFMTTTAGFDGVAMDTVGD
jgi:hypothetical protein